MSRLKPLRVGAKVSAREFKGKEWIADLIYLDGPLLSLFRGGRSGDVLVMWVDCDDWRNRWVSFDVERSGLKEYLLKRKSLKELIFASQSFLFFHTSSTDRRSGMTEVRLSEFPSEYVPDDNSYWDVSFGTSDAENLVREDVQEYRLGLDGESWFLDDFSKVTNTYRQLYAFNYAIFQQARSAIRSTISKKLSNLAWRGGFSTVQWFDALSSVTPSMHKVRVREIAYASPGHISIDALPSVSSRVANSIHRLLSNGLMDVSKEVYKETYKFLDDYSLSKLDLTNPAQLSRLEDPTIAAGIEGFLAAFLEIYDMANEEQDLLAAGASKLSLLKALLSYHRRALLLAEYVEEGSLVLP